MGGESRKSDAGATVSRVCGPNYQLYNLAYRYYDDLPPDTPVNELPDHLTRQQSFEMLREIQSKALTTNTKRKLLNIAGMIKRGTFNRYQQRGLMLLHKRYRGDLYVD